VFTFHTLARPELDLTKRGFRSAARANASVWSVGAFAASEKAAGVAWSESLSGSPCEEG
jgi:hypothetical protein